MIYNEIVKQKYLQTMKNRQVSEIFSLFHEIGSAEQMHKKDIYDFSKDELNQVLFILKPSTFKQSVQNKKIVEQYIDWAITQAHSDINFNPLSLWGNDWCEQHIVK